MSLELYIPGRTIAYRCACGAGFFHKETGIRHAAQCTKADDMIGEMLEAQESDLIGSRTPSDIEAWRWGRKRIAEGKPGFKAGRPT